MARYVLDVLCEWAEEVRKTPPRREKCMITNCLGISYTMTVLYREQIGELVFLAFPNGRVNWINLRLHYPARSRYVFSPIQARRPQTRES